ncbi:DUF1835 domain-containing protein [Pseudomonas saudiphocaensis]|uniref:DUF1835 domain-containing protein n=1 Tax=Pseudomonas saudiphocaensis TaxID=1499686 RepID=UPI000F798240|nr:DUF1835 domain-containing protein [Pseudomonas saudiphocaensis]RRV13579.1 DUF1835 domain-containing protein [Pseudomonas saudiphocaensis]
MWHLTCGDLAADSVRPLLSADDELRVLRDDLAVGPLDDVECPPCTVRVAFWESVCPAAFQPRPDFRAELVGDAEWLAGLTRQKRSVTVWHGDSASEQLLLARVAAALDGSSLPLWEVACGTGDSRAGTRMAVSLHRPEALALLYRPRLVGPDRLASLADQWRAAVRQHSLIRRWDQGFFAGEDYQRIDQQLTAACGVDWQPLARAMAEVMAACNGFFPTDMLLFWRARELARMDLLQLSDCVESKYENVQVRRPEP